MESEDNSIKIIILSKNTFTSTEGCSWCGQGGTLRRRKDSRGWSLWVCERCVLNLIENGFRIIYQYVDFKDFYR